MAGLEFPNALISGSMVSSLKPSPPLTPREREVCLLLVEGLQDKEIAGRLRKVSGEPLSPHTVRNYLSAIFLKLGVDSRELVIVWAFQSGLVKIASLKTSG